VDGVQAAACQGEKLFDSSVLDTHIDAWRAVGTRVEDETLVTRRARGLILTRMPRLVSGEA